MKIGPVVLKIRAAETRFANKVGGAAELALAMTYTLKEEMAFVVQLTETASRNDYDSGINQKINETFAVIVAIDNATTEKDKLGIIAHDTLYDVRSEIFGAILGWQMDNTVEDIISYNGGKLLRIDRAHLWYQFEFSVGTRITDEDGFDNGEDDLDWFDRIYAQYILTPSEKMDKIGENLPISIVDPDMTQIIDFTSNPDVDGGFSKGFNIIFDTYKP